MSDTTNYETTNVDKRYIEKSSCFRHIPRDENVCARIIITGLTYNIKELCLVFHSLLDEKDIDDINIYKRCHIYFKSEKITDKQQEHIRDSRNGLQKALISKLYEKKQKLKEEEKIVIDSRIFLKN